MSKKLYRVEVNFVYYAFSDTPLEAAMEASEALGNNDIMEIADAEVCTNINYLENDWSHDSLTYGSYSEDVTIKEAWERMNNNDT